MAAENRRVIVVTKKGCSDPDAMPGDTDPTSTNKFTSPLGESTDKFTSPLKESTSRFTSPLRGSTNRFTAPVRDSSRRFTSPLRGRNSSKFKSKRRDSWEASDPPSRDRSPHKSSHEKLWPWSTGRNETEPEKRSHTTDYYRRNEPPPKDRQSSPSRDSHDNFRDDSSRSHSTDYYRRNEPPPKDRQSSPSRDSHDNFRDDSSRSHTTDYYRRNEPPPKDRQSSPSRDSHDNFRDDSSRSHTTDYYRRNEPPPKDRQSSPSRDSHDNFRDDSSRSHTTDYYRRNEPPPKDRPSSPSRDSHDNFRDDSSRHNYDRYDYNNEPSSHEESSFSHADVKQRPFLDATILITTTYLRSYAERIERRLKNLNMVTEIRNMPDSLLQNQVIENIANQGVLYVIIVNSQNEAHRSLTLHIFQGRPQEHRNMPSDDAMSLVARNFERYLQVLKEKNAGLAATAAPSTSQSTSPPVTATMPSPHPPLNPDLTSPHQQRLPFLPPSAEISYLLHLLADCRHLTLQELDKVLDYLNVRKRELLEMPQPSTSQGAGDFSSGDDLQRMDNNRLMSSVPPKTDFQSKILSMLMPSNMSDNMNSSLQQTAHNLPGPPIKSGDMIPQSDQSLQSMSTNNSSNMKALINFDNPKVQKALDNLIHSGPNLLQNINAVSKNTNPQHVSTNPSMDRNQGSYNQYDIPQSADRAGPQMMSRMSGGRGGGHDNVRPNMGMNTGMNRDPIGHAPHFNRGAKMFQNGPQMMGRGPPGPNPGPHTDIRPQQY